MAASMVGNRETGGTEGEIGTYRVGYRRSEGKKERERERVSECVSK